MELADRNDTVLQGAVKRLSSELEQIKGIYDIRDNLRQGTLPNQAKTKNRSPTPGI
jgi:hypothetical protein